MTGSLLLDTDLLVDFLKGYGKAVALVNENAPRVILSSIVIAELYAGVRGDAEQTALEGFVSLFPVIPVTAGIAKAAGLFRRDYGRSHGVGLADAILAATCASEGAALKTLNVRHYPMIRGLVPAYKKKESVG